MIVGEVLCFPSAPLGAESHACPANDGVWRSQPHIPFFAIVLVAESIVSLADELVEIVHIKP